MNLRHSPTESVLGIVVFIQPLKFVHQASDLRGETERSTLVCLINVCRNNRTLYWFQKPHDSLDLRLFRATAFLSDFALLVQCELLPSSLFLSTQFEHSSNIDIRVVIAKPFHQTD